MTVGAILPFSYRNQEGEKLITILLHTFLSVFKALLAIPALSVPGFHIFLSYRPATSSISYTSDRITLCFLLREAVFLRFSWSPV
jgi:hypothetical protein